MSFVYILVSLYSIVYDRHALHRTFGRARAKILVGALERQVS